VLGDGVAGEVLERDRDVGPALDTALLPAPDHHARARDGLPDPDLLEVAEEADEVGEVDPARPFDHVRDLVEEGLGVEEDPEAALLLPFTAAALAAAGLPEDHARVRADLAEAVVVELEDDGVDAHLAVGRRGGEHAGGRP